MDSSSRGGRQGSRQQRQNPLQSQYQRNPQSPLRRQERKRIRRLRQNRKLLQRRQNQRRGGGPPGYRLKAHNLRARRSRASRLQNAQRRLPLRLGRKRSGQRSRRRECDILACKHRTTMNSTSQKSVTPMRPRSCSRLPIRPSLRETRRCGKRVKTGVGGAVPA